MVELVSFDSGEFFHEDNKIIKKIKDNRPLLLE